MTWERLINQGRAKITDDDKYDINKQTTDNQNLKAGEQWYTLKVLICVHVNRSVVISVPDVDVCGEGGCIVCV